MSELPIAKQSEIRALGKTALDLRLRSLLGDERHIAVEFLRYLEEFDRRRGWEAFGLTTLWDYCTLELGLRGGATHRRTHAMFVMRTYPQVIAMLRDGRLCMTTLALLEKWLTKENADALFRDAARKSTRYVEEEIVAKLKAPIVPTETVRELEKKLTPISPIAAELRRDEVEAAGGTVEAASATVAPETEKAVEDRLASMTVVLVEEGGENTARSVSSDQFQVNVTVSREWMETFRRLAQRLPVKSIADVTLTCMQETEKRLAKRDGRGTEAPATGGPAADPPPKAYRLVHETAASDVATAKPSPDYIPLDLERAIRRRDGNRCQWVKPDRTKCLSPNDPQLDHIHEKARGGKTEYSNLQILCAAHNRQKAREAFSPEYVATKIRQRKADQAAHHERRKMHASSLPAPEVDRETLGKTEPDRA